MTPTDTQWDNVCGPHGRPFKSYSRHATSEHAELHLDTWDWAGC